MMNKPLLKLSIATLAVACLPVFAADEKKNEKKEKAKTPPPTLIAMLHGTKGSDVSGQVVFEPAGEKEVKVTARVTGLNPNQKHGFHIHEYGDITAADGTSAGGHFNPQGHDHGLPGEDKKRHAGDLGNLEANDDGVAELELTVSNVKLQGKNSILGRGIVVHAKPDTGAQPTGDAGSRIGYGVIGLKQETISTAEKVVNKVENALERATEAAKEASEKLENTIENLRDGDGEGKKKE